MAHERQDPQTRQPGGPPGSGGTTDRDHGGKGSWMPERAQGEGRRRSDGEPSSGSRDDDRDDDSTQMEGGRTVTDGTGPGDQRSGPTGRERSDGDGTLPDSGPTTRITR